MLWSAQHHRHPCAGASAMVARNRRSSSSAARILTVAVISVAFLCAIGGTLYLRSARQENGGDLREAPEAARHLERAKANSSTLVEAPGTAQSQAAEAAQRLRDAEAKMLQQQGVVVQHAAEVKRAAEVQSEFQPPVQSAVSSPPSSGALGAGRQAWADLLLKTSGEGWAMWDGSSVIGNSSSACEWHTFKPANPGNESRMCLYPMQEDVYVSGAVARQGHWPDCDVLPKMWREHSRVGDVYVEIGANIGTCVMEMLMTTDAPIVAFEPEGSNLFHLSSTLGALEAGVRGRVALFPVGLGTEARRMSIYQASNNRGNSVVNVAVLDNRWQRMLPASTIFVERLDGILGGGGGRVGLVKMDTQGFECNAMDGGRLVFSGVRALKTEISPGHLVKQGCSPEGLAERIRGAGFNVTLPARLPQTFDVNAVRNKTV